jgi:peptidoglycan/LPS O-acetylase OafA/YrhL
MGGFRLILAVLVALSHMGVVFYGYGIGVFAVISFLIISGFVMTALIEKNYSSLKAIPSFYIDRAIRLYPQFLFYFAIACAVIFISLPNTRQSAALTAENIVPSLAIAPLGLYMYGITLPDILPPTWSLGLEVFFYLLIPFLIIFKLRGIAFAISFCIFLAACLGFINSDYYGYRLIPGVLFIFLCGSYLYRVSYNERLILGSVVGISIFLLILILLGVVSQRPYNVEVLAGIAFGIPAIHFLSKIEYHKIDEIFGNISYGVFLNHFIFIYAAQALGYGQLTNSTIAIIVIVAFICSGISYYLVERPALRIRHAMRQKSKTERRTVNIAHQ